ncbi:MAG TPA: histone-like nucleoid-structuring protein Lsr2 [Mycobacteriales bacterium]|nr:histone-like nucleoid-structuring protein Lsr2 [Mycobacteriales bacterium]
MANAARCHACGSDLGPGEGTTTRVRVTTAGISASLQLCPAHAATVAAWIARATPEQAAVVTDGFPRLRDDEDREVVRQWAEAHGLPVARTGTISARILAAYRDAHPAAIEMPEPASPSDRTVVLDTAPRVTSLR